MQAIHTQCGREQLRAALAGLPAILSGRAPDKHGIAHGLRMRVAFAFFSAVKQAFVTKSRGGTDEAGIKWPPLSKKYLAYGRRFGPGEQSALKKAAGLGRANAYAPGGNKGLLTKQQLKRWRALYAQNLAWLAAREPLPSAKAGAAAIAWAKIKREGGRTKLDVFGKRQVEILRDTSNLLRSLSPGTLAAAGPDASYQPSAEQFVRSRGAELIVGTRVKYAAAHHYGGRVPKRLLWPERGDLPKAWTDSIQQHAAQGLIEAVTLLARAAG